ncbi:uncharacterized protein BO66DRAFT_417327 [Aspergillus aculeatinus CBS 121060]|uniref:Uncharacterized protein n=1 Tax=Aspergillus aculeatinus CBS 121060 TaxID=1448322 RepID=A0ACD1HMD3_9EURO|nr:hypothetical protein BO66DRAFT_417327 [Aspergillus aculeatinus CBS 121060]RAH74627.1 hypothetical protein BO66DRAFT_417327 [Aspergillus aculeatinus CBS 121060]
MIVDSLPPSLFLVSTTVSVNFLPFFFDLILLPCHPHSPLSSRLWPSAATALRRSCSA